MSEIFFFVFLYSVVQANFFVARYPYVDVCMLLSILISRVIEMFHIKTDAPKKLNLSPVPNFQKLGRTTREIKKGFDVAISYSSS